jgi:hypothetical protein
MEINVDLFNYTRMWRLFVDPLFRTEHDCPIACPQDVPVDAAYIPETHFKHIRSTEQSFM